MTMDSKFIPAILLLLGLALGFAGGKMSSGQSLFSKSPVVDDALKARLIETGVFPAQPIEVRQLSGTIKAINGDTLTVALSYPRDPFGDPALDERMIVVNKDTTITMMLQKDQGVYAKEVAAYQTKMNTWKPSTDAAPSMMPPPPQFFEKKDGAFASLKVGDTLAITTGEDVKLKKNFAALTIEATPVIAIMGGDAIPPPLSTGTTGIMGAQGNVAPAPVTTAGTAGEPSKPAAPK